MDLLIQIYSLFFSFVFGLLLYTIIFLANRLIIKYETIKKFLIFLIILLSFLLYYLVLLYINNGYLHVYFLVVIGLGSYFSMYFNNFWFTHCKKK